MDLLLGLVIEAVFQWQHTKGTLFIGYPSKGRVIEVCINETRCFAPTNKQGDAIVMGEEDVKVVSALIEDEGGTHREYLVKSPPAKG